MVIWRITIKGAYLFAIGTVGLIQVKETVFQYTGLTDKNGRKIFEGDILLYIDRECPNDILRELVAWNGFSWVARMGKRDIVMTEWECKHMEVIGNILDNPELLEKGAE